MLWKDIAKVQAYLNNTNHLRRAKPIDEASKARHTEKGFY